MSEDPKIFVSVFYEDPPLPGATIKVSQKENDETTRSAGSEGRLKNFATYKELSKIIGYRDFTVCKGGFPGRAKKRVRAVLSADEFRDKSTNPRTNTPFAEV
ncbi:MAG: hypothetical protein ACKVQT_23470, partial [Burkholderiales bacterium]